MRRSSPDNYTPGLMIEAIRQALFEDHGISSWPEMARIVERPVVKETTPCWEYPCLACRAVGGQEEEALAGAAAVYCLLNSIHLVDDLLDEDPKGDYRTLGAGKAANLALAFQAAASRVLDRAVAERIGAAERLEIHGRLAKIALDTAVGQNMDVEEIEEEPDYWRAVVHKTPPLFGGALFIGAVLGGADLELARSLEELGVAIGKIVQVSDDLRDALQQPAAPDWRSGSNNLPILYAMTADYAERPRFIELRAQVGRPEALAAAQDILVTSGAVSYCVYHIVDSYHEAGRRLGEMALHSRRPLVELLEQHIEPTRTLLAHIGAELPEGLMGAA